MTQRLILLLVLLIYGVLGVLFAVRTPDWQAPDEPAHYNYVAYVAQNGCCPRIEMGDWQEAYQRQLTSERFAPELLDRLHTIRYENHQPPLYYLIAALIHKLTSGSLLALRLLSVLFGAGVVACAYAISRVMIPDRPGVALAAAGLVAFLPQHVAMLAAVNNDSLAELLIGLTLLAALVYMQPNAPRWLGPGALGLLVGIIFVTKSTGYFMAAVVPLAILLKWWPQRQQQGLGGLLRDWVVFLVPALLLGSLWWVRNLSVYGFPDFLGLRQHDLVVADQFRTADAIARDGTIGYLRSAFWTTFNSFWGQFGWMALPLQPGLYRVFQAALAVMAGGLLVDFFVLRQRQRRGEWLILWAVMSFALLAFLYYNTEFFQPQGRYLFPGLIPVALLGALGLDAWRRWLLPRVPLAQWGPLLVTLLLALLDLYLIWRVIPPGLSPTPS